MQGAQQLLWQRYFWLAAGQKQVYAQARLHSKRIFVSLFLSCFHSSAACIFQHPTKRPSERRHGSLRGGIDGEKGDVQIDAVVASPTYMLNVKSRGKMSAILDYQRLEETRNMDKRMRARQNAREPPKEREILEENGGGGVRSNMTASKRIPEGTSSTGTARREKTKEEWEMKQSN